MQPISHLIREKNIELATADPVARAYEVVGIPHLVLIGPDGIIVTTGDALRGEQLDATLARLLVGE